MGIDSMRVGGGRCPPLLVGGLLVACLMLICNWWTLSSENLELVRQIDELNEQLKMSTEERDQCVTLRGNLEQRYKRTEDELASLHVRLEQQTDLKKRNDELESSVTMCKNELDNLNKEDVKKTDALEKLRQQEDNINTQLDEKRDEYKKLEEELSRVKDELDKLKHTCNSLSNKKSEYAPQPTRTVVNKTQLDPVPDSAVKISVAGQRGLKDHGIPILLADPPGAVRQVPRYSVTMLKAKNFNDTDIMDKEEREMLEIEDIRDASNHGIDPNVQEGANANEDVGGEERDQQIKTTLEPDKPSNTNK